MAIKKKVLLDTYADIANHAIDLCRKDPFKEKINGYVNSVNYIYDGMVEGDVAEFGTAWGRSSAAIAAAMEYQTREFQKWKNNKQG